MRKRLSEKERERERDYHFPSKLDLHVHEVQDREQNVALSDCTSYNKCNL